MTFQNALRWLAAFLAKRPRVRRLELAWRALVLINEHVLGQLLCRAGVPAFQVMELQRVLERIERSLRKSHGFEERKRCADTTSN